MVDDRSYPSEQILIHEFGHTGLHPHAAVSMCRGLYAQREQSLARAVSH